METCVGLRILFCLYKVFPTKQSLSRLLALHDLLGRRRNLPGKFGKSLRLNCVATSVFDSILPPRAPFGTGASRRLSCCPRRSQSGRRGGPSRGRTGGPRGRSGKICADGYVNYLGFRLVGMRSCLGVVAVVHPREKVVLNLENKNILCSMTCGGN